MPRKEINNQVDLSRSAISTQAALSRDEVDTQADQDRSSVRRTFTTAAPATYDEAGLTYDDTAIDYDGVEKGLRRKEIDTKASSNRLEINP